MGHDTARLVGLNGDSQLQVVVGHVLGEPLGPFHEGNSVAVAVDGAVVVDVLQLETIVQPVQIIMAHGNAALAVFQQNVEGGARDRRAHAEGGGHPLHELGLTGAQVAIEHHHIARMQVGRQRGGELLGRLGGGSGALVCQSVCHGPILRLAPHSASPARANAQNPTELPIFLTIS